MVVIEPFSLTASNPMSSSFRSVPVFFEINRDPEKDEELKRIANRLLYWKEDKRNEIREKIYTRYLNDEIIRFMENDKVPSKDKESLFDGFMTNSDPVWVTPIIAREGLVTNFIKNGRKVEKENKTVKTVLRSVDNMSFRAGDPEDEFAYQTKKELQDNDVIDIIRAVEYGSMKTWRSIKEKTMDNFSTGKFPRRIVALRPFDRSKYGVFKGHDFPFGNASKYVDIDPVTWNSVLVICRWNATMKHWDNQTGHFTRIPKCFKKFKKLQSVHLANNYIRLVENLDNSPCLKSLTLRTNTLESITGIPKSPSVKKPVKCSYELKPFIPFLKSLTVHSSNLASLDGISKAKNLEELDVEVSIRTDFRPIASLKRVKELNLDKNYLQELPDLEPMESVTTLSVRRNSLESLDRVVKTFPNLEIIHFNDNYIKNIDPLLSLDKLRIVNAGGFKATPDPESCKKLEKHLKNNGAKMSGTWRLFNCPTLSP